MLFSHNKNLTNDAPPATIETSVVDAPPPRPFTYPYPRLYRSCDAPPYDAPYTAPPSDPHSFGALHLYVALALFLHSTYMMVPSTNDSDVDSNQSAYSCAPQFQ